MSLTEARTANLFEIIDTLHEEEGVVVPIPTSPQKSSLCGSGSSSHGA